MWKAEKSIDISNLVRLIVANEKKNFFSTV